VHLGDGKVSQLEWHVKASPALLPVYIKVSFVRGLQKNIFPPLWKTSEFKFQISGGRNKLTQIERQTEVAENPIQFPLCVSNFRHFTWQFGKNIFSNQSQAEILVRFIKM